MIPIQKYDGIFVKRDDLCFNSPAPPFSKNRGIIQYLSKAKKRGVEVVGYTETSISMAGWGVAWACEKLGLKAVIFDPQYKNTPDILQFHRRQWKNFNAKTIPVPAGRAKVNWYISRKLMDKYYSKFKCELLPLGLPFEETVEATSQEVIETLDNLDVENIVISVGSGTICAGICRGIDKMNKSITIYGIMTRDGNIIQKHKNIFKKAKIKDDGFFKSSVNLNIINMGWKYTDFSKIKSPFPCHPYYDLKAWEYLQNNKKFFSEKKTLFWNIGH